MNIRMHLPSLIMNVTFTPILRSPSSRKRYRAQKPVNRINLFAHSRQQMMISRFQLEMILRSRIYFLLRQYCSAAVSTQEGPALVANTFSVPGRRLFVRLSALGATGGKVSDVLNSHIRQGKPVKKRELIDCLRSLRKFKRYQHCLQIIGWLDQHKYNYSQKDYALILDIVSKTKGIRDAEKYFDGLSPASKNLYSYGALLNCYCTANMADKATTLFNEMDRLKYASCLAFGSIMRLYLKAGKPEEVPLLLQEMKQRNMLPDKFIYNIVLQSYASMNDLEGIERTAEEIEGEQYDWTVYSNLATAYAKIGHKEKLDLALQQLEEFLKNSENPERGAYQYLISLYATSGNLPAIDRVWNTLKSKISPCTNLCFLCMLQALSKVDHMEGLRACFEDWESQCKMYDYRLPTLVIGSYLRHGMIVEAKEVLKSATKRSTTPLCRAHEYFMAYFMDRGEIDESLRHLQEASDKVKEDTRWRPAPHRICSLFVYFERDKDLEKAEKLSELLKKLNCLGSEAYLSLLKVYAAAEKTAPGMKQRMREDVIHISSEHENLLRMVCPE